MPLFRLTTVNFEGYIQTETVFAEFEEHVKSMMDERGLTCIAYQRIHARNLSKIPIQALASFFLRLSVLLEAGHSLLATLNDVGISTKDKRLQHLAMLLTAQLRQGMSLVSCLEPYPKLFDPVIRSMIEQGMTSGKLAEHFYKAHHYLQQRLLYRNQFKKATFYPLFLFLGIILLFILFTQFLLPQVVLCLQEMGVQELPLASRLLIGFTHFCENYGVIILGVFFISLCLTLGFILHKDVQKRLTPLLQKIPIVGPFYTRQVTLPWLSSMGELYGVGVSFKACLDQSANAIHNPYIRNLIETMHNELLKGLGFNQTMTNSQLFSPFVIALCDLGMKSGQLSVFFLKAYDLEQEELQGQLLFCLKKLEPLIIIVMGSLLLWMVMGVILPLYGNINL